MKNLSVAFMTMAVAFCLGLPVYAQEKKADDAMQSCPMHAKHMAENTHHTDVEKRGDQAMGFPHDATTHHFRLALDGGGIEVTANDSNDKTNTEAVRSHLAHIAVMFSSGDFSMPMLVHDGVPPGVTTMKILKAAIRYAYADIPSGGRVHIESNDPVAVAAIHDFLRFQISEHETGDNLDVENAH